MSTLTLTPDDGDRLLDIDAVIALLPLHHGKPFSRKFVLRRVAPGRKVRLGRAVYWRRRDVEAWLRAQLPTEGRARAS
jgi:predicted DNA-binding transcriptional regulator AlpA